MATYVYGGKFQGIQSYIFSTNRLRENIGASELLNEICTEDFLKEKLTSFEIKGDYEIVQKAASTIKIVFREQDDAKKMKQEFPKVARDLVPGIEFSQTYIEQKSDDLKNIDKEVRDSLEEELNKEKNRPATLYYPNLMIVKRDNRTGLPVRAEKKYRINYIDDDGKQKEKPADESTYKKDSKANDAHPKLVEKLIGEGRGQLMPVEIERISNSNSFIAVVHADGNGLGQIISNLGKNVNSKLFSETLDDCLVGAAGDAFREIIENKYNGDKKNYYPFRPMVLGGDDFNFICKADDAVEFTKKFITLVEKYTETKFEPLFGDTNEQNKKVSKMTVCAGIAFVKENYPLHFAYELAESLCDLAKDKAKDLRKQEVERLKKENAEANKDAIKKVLIPSCIAFRKELGSFAEDFDNIKEKDKKFIFGPYAVSDSGYKLPQIDSLVKVAEVLKDNNPFKSFLRNWMSDELVNPHSAQLLKKRFMQVANEKNGGAYAKFCNALNELVPQANAEDLTLEKDGVSPVLDILTLISIAEKTDPDSKKGGENDNN